MSITLALVEDLDEVREVLQKFFLLNTHFQMLGCFANAEEAVFYLPKLQPDIVIMDINLSGKSGIDCIRSLKASMPATQFMMFTIYDTDEKVFEALKAGASGYILKSTTLPRLVDAVKELHEGGSPMSSSIARKLVTLFMQHENIPTSACLTKRENQILQLLAKGMLYKEISGVLQITVNTLKQHIHKIYEKLHVQNRTEAINKISNRYP